MRINRIVMAGLTAGMLLAGPALAEDAGKGPYLGLSGGANWMEDYDLAGGSDAGTDTGWVGLGTFGYRFGGGLRTELEAGWRDNDIDSISGEMDASGDVTAKTLMINALYDFHNNSRLTPYLGAGVGIAKIEFDGVTAASMMPVMIDDDDRMFAYQGIAGVSYALNDSVMLSTEYHYLDSDEPELTANDGTDLDGEYQSHAVLIGLRWNFGAPKAAAPTPVAAPAPAPMPVAEPEQPRNFMVFFDWDKSDITPEAAAILKDAAAYAKSTGAVRIMATGHADRSGPDTYNVDLSMRRAVQVKQTLIANGIAEDQIGLDARGEADPLTPTEDGVREPQNRRVEIVMQ